MKISLVHTPYYHQKHMENLDIASNNFGIFPPLGMMYVSSILRKHGHETNIIDVKAEGLTKDDVIKKLRKINPDLVGFMIIPFTANIVMEWIAEIKKETGLKTIAGNYGMIYYPEAVLSRDFIDYGIVGSAKESFPKLLRYIEKNEGKLEDIEGLAYKKDGKIFVNYPKKINDDLNKLPWPDRESIDNSLYYSMASKRRPFTIMVTSNGCVYNCDFCDMGKFGYSEREPKDVVDEIEYCVRVLGIKEIDIFDRDFLISKKRSGDICREIIKRGIKFEWSCRTRVDEVDEKILWLMKKSGCRLILYGIESGNQDILDREHKGITISEIKKAIKTTKKVGIETLGFFIIGHPGETRKNVEETIKLAKKLPLDYAQFFRMTGKPGAKLWEDVKNEIGYDYFEKLIKDDIPTKNLPRPWTTMCDNEINIMVKKAYDEFYMRPSYIMKKMLRLRSLKEFKKYARVGSEMIKNKLIIPRNRNRL